MKYEKGECSSCHRRLYIVNRTKHLCDVCNYKRLHGGKSRAEVMLEKQKISIKRKKTTGELELFKEIWQEREHVCVKCGKKLPEPLRSYYFSHKKSKGAFPELRLVKTNIELNCFDCHFRHEFVGNN